MQKLSTNMLRVILVGAAVLLGCGTVWSQDSSPDPPHFSTGSPEPIRSQEISVGNDTVRDASIQERLAEVYSHIPALAQVKIDVNAGVVRLGGHTPTKEDHVQALELARRVEGVVSVTDEITQKREVRERLMIVREKLGHLTNDLVSYLPLLLIALSVFALFWFLASLITRLDRPYRALTRNAFLQSLLKQSVRGAILFVGFIVMLEILDATALLGTIVGVAGVMGLALGFALRDTVENYIASILLSIRQPFRPLDHIVLENYEGLVMKLTSRETILMTLDGNHVRIPNATVYKGIILNYSRNPKRRFTFEVGIDTGVDLHAAQHLAIETLNHTPGVISDPPVRCTVEKLGDSNVILKLFAWTTQDQFDYAKVKSEAIRALKEAFDRADYEMPEPIYRLKVQGLTGSETVISSDLEIEKKNDGSAFPDQPESPGDVARDDHIVQQISEENEDAQEPNLLATARE